MSDPYRPTYYPPPPTAGSPYNSHDYVDASDQYGPLATHHRSSHSGASSGYYPQSQTQLTHTSRRDSREDDYLSPDHSHRHKSKSRHSRHHSPDSDYEHDRGSHRDRDRSNSHSRIKEAGATAVGGAAGALVGHKIGHGNIGTLAGLAVGALGARALEQQYEKREERKRMEEPFESSGRRDGRPGTRERRKSFVEQAQEKVSGFLGVGDGGKDQRRSRSHVGSGGGRERGGRYEDSDSDDYYEEKRERYERRSSKGDRHGGSSGRSRRDDY